jgi:hypothetical protein
MGSCNSWYCKNIYINISINNETLNIIILKYINIKYNNIETLNYILSKKYIPNHILNFNNQL